VIDVAAERFTLFERLVLDATALLGSAVAGRRRRLQGKRKWLAARLAFPL
jgi:hypothetical protein